VPPLVRAAVIAAVLTAVTRWSDIAVPRTPRRILVTATSASAGQNPAALCPPGTLPDARVCVPVPERAGTSVVGADADQIPRRPDRPADYARYELPVKSITNGVLPPMPVGTAPATGSDPITSGGVDIETSGGEQVRMIALENQSGAGTVAFTGEFVGPSVVVRQRVRESGQDRDYFVVYGRLAGIAQGIEPGQHLEPGALLGLAGGRSPIGSTTMHLQIRRVRQSISPDDVLREQVLDPSATIAEDVRNALRLR
jgi:hypothetical protein